MLVLTDTVYFYIFLPHCVLDFVRNFGRYLIVIDDLWDENSWNTISLSLPSNDCGSRVITTTRINKIAKKCCSKNKDLIYEIMPLGYQYSKRLFLKRCFGSEDSCHDALTEVDEILKICGGMPLAIISVASADFPLSAGKIKERCQEIMKSLQSAAGGLYYVEGLTRILLYSYLDLPDTLRDCLLYLAASAKNQRIQRDNLVRKWIAEGLIPVDKDSSREEVAMQYFDEFINRNIIQPVKYLKCLGKETYEVTYMMLYVLRLISQEQNFATFFSESEPHVEVTPNRLFMQCSDSELLISTGRVNLTNVCSVTMLGPANPVPLKQLKNVQVLDLDGCKDLDNSAMDDICRMIKLKYLSLKQTQVTEIPPEISNLQNLQTLDVSWTQISNLPPEIRKLQNLVTLDVRQTQVKDLPKEVLQLRKLKHLPFGQSGCFRFRVKLSGGMDQLKPVQVMGTVDSRECSENAMKEISELIEVTELELVLYDGLADMEKNDKLLSSVGKCSYLKSLTIYGDSNPSDKLSPESPNFPQLEKLKVAGRFVKVPGWIAQLSTLTLLDIRVWKIEANDLMIIGGLPCLSVLALALVALPRKQVTITSSAGFVRLEVFCFDCCVPWVSFQDEAMPNLKQLQLNLYRGPADKVPSGIMLLERLDMVMLLYSSQHVANDGVFETVAVVREDAASHPNLIELSINGDREIFLPNKTAERGFAEREFDTSVSRVITEVEEVLASE
ncbi:unnamed protein product [Triticum turgidum subsp. durum]|uniref:NB-ARC domain-containing protein n=1 Tax=Triticum turgidum subsp. durum TaxID=4567 RepID=A0A9R1RFH2_TRITD|nr:unnamed protein product [Triticum turgidum subsp. durum]